MDLNSNQKGTIIMNPKINPAKLRGRSLSNIKKKFRFPKKSIIIIGNTAIINIEAKHKAIILDSMSGHLLL
ncbi:MAG: hypothetical protein JXL97_01955 [Bacteroidales bacterium]|nr:hypothetical protein [Bacteroidales bacterium]